MTAKSDPLSDRVTALLCAVEAMLPPVEPGWASENGLQVAKDQFIKLQELRTNIMFLIYEHLRSSHGRHG